MNRRADEARIVVTTRNFSREVGIQWGFLNRQAPVFGNQTGNSFPNTITIGGAADPAQVGPNVGSYVVNLPATAPNSGIGVSMGNIIGSFNLDAALGALEKQGRGRILSTPKITTQDNQARDSRFYAILSLDLFEEQPTREFVKRARAALKEVSPDSEPVIPCPTLSRFVFPPE